jgi:hypothetical protein|tara:strand:+ start:272 stop:448 length:177 start_codon:yes stop_codon:yes gene_type:complete
LQALVLTEQVVLEVAGQAVKTVLTRLLERQTLVAVEVVMELKVMELNKVQFLVLVDQA